MTVVARPVSNVVDISMLRMHPKNTEIYGEEDVTALAQSIAESGWIKPLTVTPDYVIISGHRRYQAAMQLGYTELPIEIETFISDICVRFDELQRSGITAFYRKWKGEI